MYTVRVSWASNKFIRLITMDIFTHMCEQVHAITTIFTTMWEGAWCLGAENLCSKTCSIFYQFRQLTNHLKSHETLKSHEQF